jgi:DnaJ family protein C protein 17
MDSNAADLLQYAQEYASKDVDIYDLLGIDALTPKEDIHRAWRKRSLKYHPDKAGDNFDAEKWQLFERARDVLLDAAARAAYDNAIKAVLLRKQERDAMDKQRKHFVDDLEARENAWKLQKEEKEQSQKEAIEKERARLHEEHRMRQEEEKRQVDAAQELEDLAEAKRRLKEKKEKKKQDDAREKFLRTSKKAAAAAVAAGDGKPQHREPLHGVIQVPGDYDVDLGEERRKYWELVCDKLKAVQAVRNLGKRDATPDEEDNAQQTLRQAKLRMHQAEVKYAEESRNVKEVRFA